ncbi:MAG: hypothetical protein JW818_06860 [Pirellulales bacterium]|nr:hypothetical protein [Pirellulales bacterium]
MSLLCLLIGNLERREFAGVEGPLRGRAEVERVQGIDEACRAVEEGRVVPDVVVLAQAYPGEFSHGAVDRLRRAAPLARVVGLLGSWCEGEMRTGSPWPGVSRVYWHQWPAHCAQELDHLAAGQASLWSLPVTATDEERLLVSAYLPSPFGRGAGGKGGSHTSRPLNSLLAISAWTHEMYNWLADALRRRGHATVWLRPGEPIRVDGIAAAIWDATEMDALQTARLRRLTGALAPAPIIALLDFPRIEDTDRALAAGATAVLSKPLVLEDLFWHLDRVTCTSW